MPTPDRDERVPVVARVRHEQDRSYTVIVTGPDGEQEVGSTRRTSEVRQLARAGAARLHGVRVEDTEHGSLRIPRPPYGQDGQWVRVVRAGGSTDPDELADVGAVGRAYWFGAQGAWVVTIDRSGPGIFPGEDLDFEPDITDEERAGPVRAQDTEDPR